MANLTGAQAPNPADIELFRTLAAEHLNAEGKPNITRIARLMNKPRRTISGWSIRYLAADDAPRIEMPAFVVNGDDEEPIDEILNRKEKLFERKAKANADRQWFEIKVNETRPYGILLVGDPHLDDDGCNVPLIRKHLAYASQDGVYAVNIGDSSNNWVGRLERLYAHQETSKHTGKRLVKWFMLESGASWLCWILGNHDVWGEGADFHLMLAEKKIPVIDWRAQFTLKHPSGTECRIDASHGRKGSSIWNNLHATLRSAKLGELADCYVTGHTHHFGLEHLEIAERRHACWLVQLRGYKYMDSYALRNGFAESQLGSSVLMIVDPSPDARTKVQCFEDVDLGMQVLGMLRQ